MKGRTGGTLSRNDQFGGNGLRDTLLLMTALATGWWAHGDRVVKAANPSSNIQFQLGLRSQPDALAIYSADDRAIYVYEGATTGNNKMSCSYKFLVGYPGAVQRMNCDMGRLDR